jgi:hypothetical protein
VAVKLAEALVVCPQLTFSQGEEDRRGDGHERQAARSPGHDARRYR